MDEKIIKLYKNYSPTQIAGRLKITKDKVIKILKKNDVKIRQGGSAWRNGY